MSKTPWTPGPWEAVDGQVWSVIGYPPKDAYYYQKVLADVRHTTGWPRHEELPGEANARLIAAAPEMAEALIDVTASLVAAISLLERGGKKAAASDKMFEQMLVDYHGSVKRSRAVLAKARGEQ